MNQHVPAAPVFAQTGIVLPIALFTSSAMASASAESLEQVFDRSTPVDEHEPHVPKASSLAETLDDVLDEAMPADAPETHGPKSSALADTLEDVLDQVMPTDGPYAAKSSAVAEDLAKVFAQATPADVSETRAPTSEIPRGSRCAKIIADYMSAGPLAKKQKPATQVPR